MVKIYFHSQAQRKDMIIDENTSIRNALDQAGMDYAGRLVMLSGETVTDLDETFADLGVTETATVSVNAKTQNAACIVLAGDVAVIKSAVSFEDIETLEKYAPKALSLYEEDDDGRKVEIFKVGTAKGAGKVNAFGISFVDNGAETANITVALPAEAREQYVMDKLGPAVVKLGKLEEGFAAALAGVADMKAEIEGFITRA